MLGPVQHDREATPSTGPRQVSEAVTWRHVTNPLTRAARHLSARRLRDRLDLPDAGEPFEVELVRGDVGGDPPPRRSAVVQLGADGPRPRDAGAVDAHLGAVAVDHLEVEHSDLP